MLIGNGNDGDGSLCLLTVTCPVVAISPHPVGAKVMRLRSKFAQVSMMLPRQNCNDGMKESLAKIQGSKLQIVGTIHSNNITTASQRKKGDSGL